MGGLVDPDKRKRAEIVSSLQRIGTPAVEPLIEALRAPDVGVRRGAAVGLGRIGNRWAVDSLIQALRDPNEEVRWYVAWALGEIGDPHALPELERMAQEDTGMLPWGRLADAACRAAERIQERMR